MAPFLRLAESDRFYFDADAAERPILFIEKFLKHYEDRYAGKPFLLLDWQKQVTRDLFGWKRKADGLRRFRELYLEIAKGNGKSPFITALALYVFFSEHQQGQHIFSIATDFKQANITFDMAKRMIAASPKLSERVGVKQYDVEYPDRNSKWSIMSGTAEGKHGFRPNVIVADEAHEWDNRKLYDNVTSNMLKRSEPLMLIATNAGTDRHSICYELHERGMKVLEGKSDDETLYPVIYATDPKADWRDEKEWAKANPSLGHTITLEALRLEAVKAKENRALENRFRRLYLSQWLQASTKWIDLEQWDKCVGKPTEPLEELPLYVGVDLSLSDDLSAIAFVWVGKQKLYVRTRLYIPRATAFKYEDSENVPYTEWADSSNKYITLLDGDTIDDRAQRRFESVILKAAKKHKLQEVAYDRYRATNAVARLEKQGVTCVPIRQTFEGISAACLELQRRLKDGTVVLPDNACLRWQAESVEVMTDKFGNIRPVKEQAKGRYAGRRSTKIDGIVAIITALSRAMRHEMKTESNALSQWDGRIIAV